jgi:spermidine synthase
MQSAQQIESDGYYQEAAPLQQTSTRYPVTRCYVSQRTPFADVVIVESSDYGRMLFLDRELQSASFDERIYHETLVHPLIHATTGSRQRVLVIGGAEGATVREVLKWCSNKVAAVDWVDIDGELVDLCRDYLRYADSTVYNDHRVRYYNEDIMSFLRSNNRLEIYDSIIIDLPDPDPNEQVLYGSEFWQLIRRSLKQGGGVASHVGPVEPGRRAGLEIVRQGAERVGLGNGHAYHTFVPCFQGEWGFWMNKRPTYRSAFPHDCRVIDRNYQNTIFHWDRHWGMAEQNTIN